MRARESKRTRALLWPVGSVAAIAVLWALTATPDSVHVYNRRQLALNLVLTCVLPLGGYLVLGTGRLRARAVRAGVFGLVLALGVLLVESLALLGAVDYRVLFAPKGIGMGGPSNRVLDRELAFRRPPHDRFNTTVRGDACGMLGAVAKHLYEYEAIYDRWGFRNARDLEQADVVVIGDSFVEGYKVTQTDLVSSRLAAQLDRDVANLGQCDYGPGQELTVLRKYGVQLRPRVVAWFFYEGNDLLDDYSPDADWERTQENDARFGTRSFFVNGLSVVRGVIDGLRSQDARPARELQGSLRGETYYFELSPPTMDEANLERLAAVAGILRAARETCDETGIRLLICYVPTKFSTYAPLLTFPEDGPCAAWEPGVLATNLRAACEAVGIDFVDLQPALRRSAEEGEQTYFTDDGHWTPRGHAVVAGVVADYLRDKGWLE